MFRPTKMRCVVRVTLGSSVQTVYSQFGRRIFQSLVQFFRFALIHGIWDLINARNRTKTLNEHLFYGFGDVTVSDPLELL
jgi:uncharacterized tellurite resistance protein B-like protein